MQKKSFLIGILSFLISKITVYSILIDNFTEPGQGDIQLTTSTELQPLCTDPTTTISRELSVDTDSTTICTLRDGSFQYSGTESISLTYSPSQGYFNMSKCGALRFNFANYSDKIEIDMSIQDVNSTIITSQIKIDGDSVNTDLTVYSNLDFTQISAFQFQLQPDPSQTQNGTDTVSFTLNSIEAVPEPFSIITLGTGIAAFVKRKRNIHS